MVCEALRKHGVTAPIDAHLMVKPVDRIIPDFAAAGATYITFHPEASDHIDRTLQHIRDCGCQIRAGLQSGDPAGLPEICDGQDRHGVADDGQSRLWRSEFHQRHVAYKLREARRLIDDSGLPIRLEVDGGVKLDNIRRIAEAGADTFVAGSAIFNTPDYRATLAAMRVELAQANG
jgi:ribulose-phosphate 3-epimerase